MALIFCALRGEGRCATVTLAWDPSPDPTVQGYILHCGTSPGNYTQHIDVGKATTYTLSGLQDGATYYLAVTAYDQQGNESVFSNEIVYGPSPGTGAESSGGGCFIATAAFGPMEPEVAVLRAFRDSRLLTNPPGRMLVAFYYRLSPSIAEVIRGDQRLRQITRMALMPLVYGVKHPAAAISFLLFPLFLWILSRTYRRIRLYRPRS